VSAPAAPAASAAPIVAWRRSKPAAADPPAQAGANPTYHAE
jgi:hypothetical protein